MSVTITWAVPVCDGTRVGAYCMGCRLVGVLRSGQAQAALSTYFCSMFFFLDWAGWVSGAAPVHGTKSIPFPWEHSAECNSTDKQMI